MIAPRLLLSEYARIPVGLVLTPCAPVSELDLNEFVPVQVYVPLTADEIELVLSAKRALSTRTPYV